MDEITMDEDSRITIGYLRSLPRGAVVHWSSHHVHTSFVRPWTTNWVDVSVDDEGGPDMSWVWTIIGPDDRDGTGPEQLWQFVVSYDLVVHRVWEPREGLMPRPINEWVGPRGEAPPRCIAAAYEPLARRVGGWYEVRGGWSVNAITDALERWAATHAARTDLRFEWNPEGEPYPAVRVAMRRAREQAEGAPSWDLGDGLVVADGLMDELLAMDPEEAADVVEILREVPRRALGGPEEGTDDSP